MEKDNVRTHFSWSIEHPGGQCPFCGGKTVLIVAPGLWDADEESAIETVGQERYENELVSCQFIMNHQSIAERSYLVMPEVQR